MTSLFPAVAALRTVAVARPTAIHACRRHAAVAVARSKPASRRLFSTHSQPSSSSSSSRAWSHRSLAGGGIAALLSALLYGYGGGFATTTYYADDGKAAAVDDKGPDTPLAATPSRKGGGLISMDEVARHASLEDGLWVVIAGEVYDLTDFAARHPGGDAVIFKHAGQDVTELYEPIHPSTAIEDNLTKSQHVGSVDLATIKEKAAETLTPRERRRRAAVDNLPPVGGMLCLDDFERVAHATLTDQAWAYYSSAADDEITKHQNRSAYSRVWFKPRVLRAVAHVDASTTLLGHDVALPVYISPAAMAKLGHPDGELNLTRAAGEARIIQGISANASVALKEMLAARKPEQALVYQLYVNRDRSASERILRTLQEQPNGAIAAVMLTVDAPVMGNRESDMRAKGEVVKTGGGSGGEVGGKGVAAAISGYIDPDITWDIIDWYRQHCKLPLILKGVQSVEDVALAVKHGCKAVVLSNHGGRSLEYAPAPMDVLIELHQQRPELLQQIDVLIDGGVRRGTDVLKAMALGAKGVGLGRPFLYAQSNFGQAGAARAIAILREEIERGMRLLGITSLAQLSPDMVDVLPRSFDPYLLHRKQEREREYVFEREQQQQHQANEQG